MVPSKVGIEGIIMTKAVIAVLIAAGLFSAVVPAALASGGPPRCVKDCK